MPLFLFGFRLLIEHPLHRRAYRLVRAVNATDPTAGTTFAFQKFFARSLDAAMPGFNLFGILNPTDKLIARQRRNVSP